MVRAAAIVGLAVMLTSVSPATSAGFVTNKEGWERLSSEGRRWYAAGAFDEIATASTEDRQAILDIKLGIIKCARDQDMSVETMSRFITAGYQNDPKRWAYPASAVLYGELLKACSMYLPSTVKGGAP